MKRFNGSLNLHEAALQVIAQSPCSPEQLCGTLQQQYGISPHYIERALVHLRSAGKITGDETLEVSHA